MRIVFSRKGFDGTTGGCPSPVVNGRPISLPIPTRGPTGVSFGDLAPPIADMVRDLTRDRLNAATPCHPDPDLDPALLPRRSGWRGSLGQVAAALSHLRREGVGKGDLFLFWGSFRDAELSDGRWRFSGPSRHLLFGWLQVGEVLDLGADGSWARTARPWLADCPHARAGWSASNALFIATDELRLNGRAIGLPGWGLLDRGFRLTDANAPTPSLWSVPAWLDPALGGTGLTYHHRADRWGDRGRLQTVARGQEFVADATGREDAAAWVMDILRRRT